MSYRRRLLIAVVALFSQAFWVCHLIACRQKNEIQVAELAKRQKYRFRRAVTRQTRNLSTALAAAQHTNSEQMRLMAFIGHDLRAPIASIVGYARLLGSSTTNAGHTKHIAAIEQGAQHQLALIDELLEFVRGDFNLFGIKPVALNLRELLEDIRQQALILAARQNNTYIFVLPEPFPSWVMVDGKRLNQVLLNLISNAAKFTRDGIITLAISASSHGADWTIYFELSDTGTGIDAADQVRIFDSFEQAQSLNGGLGLGLFIARSIVQNMGGRLTLRSALGAGSAFQFKVIMSAVDPMPSILGAQTPAGLELAPKRTNSQLTQVFRKPSPALLERLALLAAGGQWTEIHNWMNKVLIEQPECSDFITIVEGLLEEFDFHRILELSMSDVDHFAY